MWYQPFGVSAEFRALEILVTCLYDVSKFNRKTRAYFVRKFLEYPFKHKGEREVKKFHLNTLCK